MADPSAVDTPMSKWRQLANWLRAGSSTPVPIDGDVLQNTQNSLFLDLPPEMRGYILKFVSASDIKRLRLTCQQCKYDVENDLGLCITCLTCQPKKPTFMSALLGDIGYSWFNETERKKRACWWSKWRWLQSIRVSSLKMNLEGCLLPLPSSGESLLRNPYSLKVLKLRLTDLQVIRDQVNTLLNQFTGLKTFYLEHHQRTRFIPSHVNAPQAFVVSRDQLRDYNTEMSKFYEATLRTLSSTSLSDLKINVRFDNGGLVGAELKPWYPLWHSYIGFPPPFQGPPIHVPSRLHTLYIRDLSQFRDVMFPYALGTQLHTWKALIDSQTQLTSLTMLLGKVYWKYYETVIKKCCTTLKFLTIHCGNWKDPLFSPGTIDNSLNDYFTEEVDIPAPDLFNWTELFGSNCLESLSISMPSKSHLSGNGTIHFCHKKFEQLKYLTLYCVKLSQDDLRKVLLELPRLKYLCLIEWYVASINRLTFTEYEDILEQTFEYVNAALVLRRLEDIKLFGMLVSGRFYSDHLGFQGSAIMNPGYQAIWSPRCATLRLEDTWWCEEPTLFIRRRPGVL